MLLSGTALAQEAVTIRFVQTNDIDRMSPEKGRGGFAKLATVIKEEKAKGNAFFVHAGDTISPSLLSGFDKGAHVIDILNRMGVDAMAPGNHEFDLGDAAFRARMAEAKFDVLATNIVDGNGLPANTKPDKMVEVQGVKVAFFGLTTKEIPMREPGHHQVLLHHRRPRQGEGAAREGRRHCRRRGPHAARSGHDHRPLRRRGPDHRRP